MSIETWYYSILTRGKASTCLSSLREPRVFGLSKFYWPYKSQEVLMRPFIRSAWSVSPSFHKSTPSCSTSCFSTPPPPPLQRRWQILTQNSQFTLRLKQNFFAHNLSSLRHRGAIMWVWIIYDFLWDLISIQLFRGAFQAFSRGSAPRLFSTVKLSESHHPKCRAQVVTRWEVVAYESLDHNWSNFFFIRIWQLPRPMRNANAVFSKVNSVIISFEKKSGSSHWKTPFLVLVRDMIMLQHLIIYFRSIICQVVAYGRLNTKENFQLLAPKVVAFAYGRWSLTRGSKCSD